MNKFRGPVGYGVTTKVAPGVYENEITERKYFGDVVKNTRRLQEADQVNPDLNVTNSISIVADAYAYKHFHTIMYVEWHGVRWIVTEVEVQRPRLILRLGGVYNGEGSGPST